MKSIIVSLLFIISLCSGCILQQGTTNNPIVSEKSYTVNEVLKEMTFNLPKRFSQPVVSFTLKLPNGKTTSSFRGTFSANTMKCSVSTQSSIILYYPGMWHMDYQIFNGSTQVIEGDYNFWVLNKTYRGLDRYKLELFKRTGDMVSINVVNNGKSSGYVSIIVYNDDPINGTITVYGKEYVNTRVLLKPGFRYTDTIQVTGDPKLKIKLNEFDFFLLKE
jgi:hypothetical protein